MKIYMQENDQPVFGLLVRTFPEGIGKAFSDLMKSIPDGEKRSYYGISKINDTGTISYWAVAEEKNEGEAEKYGYERFTIPKAEYLSEVVFDWKSKTACIKDVFHEMMQDPLADATSPCIEWYYAEDEMLCMLQKK